MDKIYGKTRLSIPSDWKPTFPEFKEMYLIHGIVIDFEAEYKNLYGKGYSTLQGDSKENESVRPAKKGSSNSKL